MCTAMFLRGTALTWYGNNIDSSSHQQDSWSFETVVMGLNDRFLYNLALGSAHDEFENAISTPEEGVMAFYYRLTWYAARMAWPPD